MVGHQPPQRADEVAALQAPPAGPQRGGVHGVLREAVLAQHAGHVVATAHGDLGQRGKVARNVSGEQLRLIGLPEALGGCGQLIAGRRRARLGGSVEHGCPGGPFSGLVGDGGPAARCVQAPGRGGVGAGLALELGWAERTEYGQPQQDLPAQPGIPGERRPERDPARVGGYDERDPGPQREAAARSLVVDPDRDPMGPGCRYA